MYIVICCSLLALFFTYLESQGKMENGMLWGFIVVTLLGCLHYNYGNDYMSYYLISKQVEQTPFDFKAIMAGEMYREPGWVILNYLFKYCGGFFVMVAVLNIIQNAIVYNFIKKEVPSSLWTFAIFIYLFSRTFYLINFSMMRQGLAVCVFLFLWHWIESKKWYWALITIYLGSFVHSSMILLLPFAFWGYVPFNNKKRIGIIFVCIFILLWFSADLVNAIISNMRMFSDVDDYIERYGMNENNSFGSVGIGFVLSFIPIVVTFLYFFQKDENSEYQTRMVALSLIGIMMKPLGASFILAGRIAMYFSIYSLAVFPMAYGMIKNKDMRMFLISLFAILTFFDYWKFFSVDGANYLTFHTIFEAL